MITYAHTIKNACRAGLILAGEDSDNEPEWIGKSDQLAQFRKWESDENLL